MRCEVKNCTNSNRSKKCNISFYKFPSDAILLKQWKKYCCRDKAVNVKNGVICMEHFQPDDFENSLEYEMGFTKRRVLKRGVVPSVFKASIANEDLHKKRAERNKKRENKKIVEKLIEEYDAEAALLTDAFELPLHEINPEVVMGQESDPLLQEKSLPSTFIKSNKNNDVDNTEIDIDSIRKENIQLKNDLNNQAAEITYLKNQRQEEATFYEDKINALETRLFKSNYELQSLEEKLSDIFSMGQIAKLKNGLKRRLWTDDELTQALTMYNAGRKIYKMLYRKKFPLPAPRTLLHWQKNKKNKNCTKEDDIMLEQYETKNTLVDLNISWEAAN